MSRLGCDHHELAVLGILKAALVGTMEALIETHDLTHADEDTPYYRLPRTSIAWIAMCLIATAGALRDILTTYQQATTITPGLPSGPD